MDISGKKYKAEGWFRGVTARHWLVFLILLAIGISLIIGSTCTESETSPLHITLRDSGISLLPLSLIGLAYEFLLRKSFLRQMKENVADSIERTMPGYLKNLRNSGLVNAYPELEVYNLKNHLINCDVNTEIKILDIWFENLYQFEDIIINLIINKNCTFKILLWDLRSEGVLKRRAHSLGKGKNVSALMNSILDNLKTIEHLFLKLQNIENGKFINNFQIKTYTSFIGISLFGIGYDYYLGFYLHERYSSHGTQFKISGYDRFFYLQIAEHFKKQWEDQTNTLYNPGDIGVFERYYMEFLLKVLQTAEEAHGKIDVL